MKQPRATKHPTELTSGEEAPVPVYWELPAKLDAKTVLIERFYDYNFFAFDVAS
jgi:hypothetical protein